MPSWGIVLEHIPELGSASRVPNQNHMRVVFLIMALTSTVTPWFDQTMGTSMPRR
jgi:hypothetical protein